jgi:hypothetical protein
VRESAAVSTPIADVQIADLTPVTIAQAGEARPVELIPATIATAEEAGATEPTLAAGKNDEVARPSEPIRAVVTHTEEVNPSKSTPTTCIETGGSRASETPAPGSLPEKLGQGLNNTEPGILSPGRSVEASLTGETLDGERDSETQPECTANLNGEFRCLYRVDHQAYSS